MTNESSESVLVYVKAVRELNKMKNSEERSTRLEQISKLWSALSEEEREEVKMMAKAGTI